MTYHAWILYSGHGRRSWGCGERLCNGPVNVLITSGPWGVCGPRVSGIVQPPEHACRHSAWSTRVDIQPGQCPGQWSMWFTDCQWSSRQGERATVIYGGLLSACMRELNTRQWQGSALGRQYKKRNSDVPQAGFEPATTGFLDQLSTDRPTCTCMCPK